MLEDREGEVDVGWEAWGAGRREMETEGISWGRGGKCWLRVAKS